MSTSGKAVIVGYIDGRGYLSCADCAAKNDGEWGRIVWSDSAPHNSEPCDICGDRLDA